MNKQHDLGTRFVITAALVLAVGLTALGLSGGVFNVNGAPPLAAAPGETHQLFMPMLNNVTQGITGHVTDQGGPSFGAPIGLRLAQGGNSTIIMTSTTTASGVYWFQNPPALVSPSRYSARFDNPSNTPGQLNFWQTGSINKYNAGDSVILLPFDVADVALGSPANNSTMKLPVTFSWIPRPSSPSDSYLLSLSDHTTSASFTTNPLGYVSSFTLTVLPPGFGAGDKSSWNLKIQSPDGGSGQSSSSRTVFITP